MKYFYFLFIFLFPLLSSAQVSLGIVTGGNFGKFGGIEPPDASYTSRAGLNFGATLEYKFNEDISLAFQPYFSQRGSNIEVGEDSRWDTLEVYQAKINFIVLPIYVRVYADNDIVYFTSGVEFGIPLSAEISHNDDIVGISDKIKQIDILASIGIGLHFSLGHPELLIEFRYYQGLVNFNSSNENDQGIKIFENFKNSGFQLMAGLEWEL